MLTRDEVIEAVRVEGSRAAAARKLGVSRQRVSQILGTPEALDVRGKPATPEQAKTQRQQRLRGTRKQAAENRAKGLCSCGRTPPPGKKTCTYCRSYGAKNAARIREYADRHGITLIEARIACRGRRWKKEPASRFTRAEAITLCLYVTAACAAGDAPMVAAVQAAGVLAELESAALLEAYTGVFQEIAAAFPDLVEKFPRVYSKPPASETGAT